MSIIAAARPLDRGLGFPLAVVALLLGSAAHAETWELYTYNPVATVAASRGMTRISEEVEKATAGDFKIKVHLGGSLQINSTNITSAVADNIVQIADDSFFTGNIPVSGVIRLPMLIRDDAEYEKVEQIIMPYMQAAYANKGVIALGQYAYPPQVAWSRKKLTSLAEFKGLKFRVTSPEQGELIRRFGGSSVTLGAPEVPSALDRGVIDGGLTASSGLGWVWRDLVKYNYRLGINYVNSIVIANKEAFDKLPMRSATPAWASRSPPSSSGWS